MGRSGLSQSGKLATSESVGRSNILPSKTPRAGQGKSGNIKKFRSDVAKLKSLGLTSARVDARSQKPTRYMRKKVESFRDVLEGRAKSVHVPQSVAKEYSEAYRRTRSRVIVPTEAGETVFYDKKQKRVVATRKGYEPGMRLRREFLKTGEVTQPLPAGYVYLIPLGSGEQRFDTWEDAVIFMQPYESGPHKYHGALGDWKKYLMVERVEDADEYA